MSLEILKRLKKITPYPIPLHALSDNYPWFKCSNCRTYLRARAEDESAILRKKLCCQTAFAKIRQIGFARLRGSV